MNGAHIGTGSIVAAGSVVPPARGTAPFAWWQASPEGDPAGHGRRPRPHPRATPRATRVDCAAGAQGPAGRPPAASARVAVLRRRHALTSDQRPGEEDLDRDDAQALSRATGGGPADEPDAATTTGTGESDEFVGRVAGQDAGYAGETGAERRAAQQE